MTKLRIRFKDGEEMDLTFPNHVARMWTEDKKAIRDLSKLGIKILGSIEMDKE